MSDLQKIEKQLSRIADALEKLVPRDERKEELNQIINDVNENAQDAVEKAKMAEKMRGIFDMNKDDWGKE